jgi:REP element-mobilizing transposase RayT
MYFITFKVIGWIDLFTRPCYCDIVLESLAYCRQNKGLQISAYVIMSNHIHCILNAREGNLSAVLRDFKRHTANRILVAASDVKESRRHWLVPLLRRKDKDIDGTIHFQVWEHANHAKELVHQEFTIQKLNYIHMNPVRAGYVDDPAHWVNSSYKNYIGKPGRIEIDPLTF